MCLYRKKTILINMYENVCKIETGKHIKIISNTYKMYRQYYIDTAIKRKNVHYQWTVHIK